MKLTKIVLATAFVLSGTVALAQARTAEAATPEFGSSAASSAGSYVWPSEGRYSKPPTSSNTFHSSGNSIDKYDQSTQTPMGFPGDSGPYR
ncbi:hypothetical protein SAMN05444158_6558 [Bradyrhizobium canariense]|uniref:Uncharacterized protein n=1 Tax=Bradyrhizobium canariense TaxID=255045 RepID=A0A1H2AWK5_9BRAD|nr:hypothetical protein SAMN05444158_6558 [Bradyrhizobium canariense]